jgi:hypothetical protein
MYIHFESSAQAVATFRSPTIAMNQTDVGHRKGWTLEASPSHQALPPRHGGCGHPSPETGAPIEPLEYGSVRHRRIDACFLKHLG